MDNVKYLMVFILWGFMFCPNVESRDGYSYADCTYLQGNQETTQYGRRCFCYNSGRGIKWKDIWSTFQVRITETDNDDIVAVYPMETRNCHDPADLLMLAKCTVEHYWPPAVQRGKTLDIPLVEEDVCFMVKSPRASASYNLQLSGKRINKMRFGLFLGGLALFFLAGSICRSSIFYYTLGVSLGTVSILLLLLFVLKNFIPKRGVFLMFFGVSSGVSYLGLQRVMLAWEDITKHYWREMLGYLAVTCLISFAMCYKRGPISCERTLSLMTWCVQGAALALLWAGISYPPAAYTLLGALLSLKLLPLLAALLFAICRGIWGLLCGLVGLFRRRPSSSSSGRPAARRFLTEEEYREQGEVQTRASLEQLRESCRTPGFPAWDTVLKLSNPQRFAEFLRGGSHVNNAEQDSHEVHYGLGGAYYENVLFNGERERGWGLHHGLGDNLYTAGGGGGAGGRVIDGGDISEDEPEPVYSHAPPPRSPSPPAPSPSPSMHTAASSNSFLPPYMPPHCAPPSPPPTQFMFCPYPPAPASALYPEPMEVEDEDEDLF
ncbi:nuclear envelope integral membrane protein 2 [Engraulis encrasicolus]|uniref:nuclear envelope integral membrane protein 2 n=1 Tax=Engraulis encrasicolus TaxID=184585 RepID=UPI002FD50A64